jgi:hypothetical protein
MIALPLGFFVEMRRRTNNLFNACSSLPAVTWSFPQSIVTSNLDPQIQKADYGQGGGGIRKNRGAALNSFVIKILTSKPLGLKILQGIFVEPAPVKAFRELGGGGVPTKPADFPKMKLPGNAPRNPNLEDFFQATFAASVAQKIARPCPRNPSPTTKRKAHPTAVQRYPIEN